MGPGLPRERRLLDGAARPCDRAARMKAAARRWVQGTRRLSVHVVARAEAILQALEEGEQSSKLTRLADDLPLFATMAARPRGRREAAEPSAAETALRETNPDALTPREALELLYRLRGMVADG